MVLNDFNTLQTCVNKMGYDKWWIRVPDHINYFNFISIKSLLEKSGFHVVHQTTDFPMDLFLLTGNNHVSNLTIGKKCHVTRMNFEKNMKPEILRKLYSSFTKNNIGRTCITYAKIR